MVKWPGKKISGPHLVRRPDGRSGHTRTGPFSVLVTFWAISRLIVGILTWGFLQMKAEIICFRNSYPYFSEKSTPKGSKSRLNIAIGHFACYSIGNRTPWSFDHIYVNISASSSNFDMRSIAYESWHPGASEVWSPIFAYSIGNRGKMGSKTKKGLSRNFVFQTFYFRLHIVARRGNLATWD